jgi:hypothetical protein
LHRPEIPDGPVHLNCVVPLLNHAASLPG